MEAWKFESLKDRIFENHVIFEFERLEEYCTWNIHQRFGSLKIWIFKCFKVCEFEHLMLWSLKIWKFANLYFWILKNLNVWIYENLNIQIFESLKIWIFKCFKVWIFEYLMYESSKIWKIESSNVWKYSNSKNWKNIALETFIKGLKAWKFEYLNVSMFAHLNI